MRASNIVSGTLLFLFAQTVFAQGAPPSGLPPGAVPCGGGWCVGGVVWAVGSAATIQSGAMDAARSGAANPESQRGSPFSRGGGFGASMGIKIQGDGIGLPKGVGEKTQEQSGSSKDAAGEKGKDSADEKAKGENAEKKGQGPDMASSSPAVPNKTKSDDADSPKAKDPKQDDKNRREIAAPTPGRGSPPPGVGERRPDTGPLGEKEADPVARRIDEGLERNPGVTRPTETRVRGSGIEVPRCFGESREGENC